MVMINEITLALENGEHVVGIFLNFSKANDAANHDVLFNQLNNHGIRENALEWFTSYLSGHRQYVIYNGCSSNVVLLKVL